MTATAAVTPRRSLVWWATLLVAACGVIATAHGLYAVAVACGVPWQVAVLYPAMADGLAVVAYAATKRLASTRYPWAVVIVAAGLSGLAQGVNLAGLGEPGPVLRFGVGFGPVLAVLASVHLLWLIRVSSARGLHSPPENVGPRVTPTDAGGPGDHPVSPNPGPSAPALNGNGHGETLKAQAEREALEYLKEHGELPSENVLAGLAGCSRGTARNALMPLRRG
jgi:hypothetical protein